VCTPNRILVVVVVVVDVCLPPAPTRLIFAQATHVRCVGSRRTLHTFSTQKPATPALERKKGKVKSASRYREREDRKERDDDDDELID